LCIAVRSQWRGKQTPIKVTVTRVSVRQVSYIAADKSFAGTLPQWQFLQDFRPVTERKKGRPSR
jgi:hypothetical protein